MSVVSVRGGGLTFRRLLVPWVASLIGFLVGEYGSGLVLTSVARTDVDAAVGLVWLPWIVAPVLAGVCAGAVVRVDAATRWWHGVVAGVLVPVGAGVVTAVYFSALHVDIDALWLQSAVQIVISVVLAVVVVECKVRLVGRADGSE